MLEDEPWFEEAVELVMGMLEDKYPDSVMPKEVSKYLWNSRLKIGEINSKKLLRHLETMGKVEKLGYFRYRYIQPQKFFV